MRWVLVWAMLALTIPRLVTALLNFCRQEIAQVCKNAGERNILVTHGTDTILQTATFLARSLSNQQVPAGHRDPSAAGRATSQSGPAHSCPYDRSQTVASTPGGTTSSVVTPVLPEQADTDCCSVPDKVVVLTGAFLPERFKDTDADFNIGVAVGAMQGGLAAGVYVSLGGRVWPWDRVTRVESGEYVSLQWDVVPGWLLNVPATCECIPGTDLLRQVYLLPHWDRSYRPNFPSHTVTVYWHRADQSQHWSYIARQGSH